MFICISIFIAAIQTKSIVRTFHDYELHDLEHPKYPFFAMLAR